MTTSTWAFGKASAAKCLGAKSATGRCLPRSNAACYTTGNGSRPADPAVQRELVLDVLSAHATKRDAKQYLARFQPPRQSNAIPSNPSLETERVRPRDNQDRVSRSGVNLGGLYSLPRAVAESPQFTKHKDLEEAAETAQEEVHVALVCLRAPETLDDATLDGVALTLSQLVKLDTRILVVLDCGIPFHSGSDLATDARSQRLVFAEQGDRICEALARHGPGGGRKVTDALELDQDASANGTSLSGVSVSLPALLMEPLNRGTIPIVPTFAYSKLGKLTRTPVQSVMTAITAAFAGVNGSDRDPAHRSARSSVDRIILLDSLGGIPSKARGDGAHVFVNLQQEYDLILGELAEYGNTPCESTQPSLSSMYEQHSANLTMIRDCLALLPSASSALIVTPAEAATSSKKQSNESSLGTGTRRQKNTLIYNLLTNKPMVSSSLPPARLPASSGANGKPAPSILPGTTLLKRCMPLKLVPAVSHGDHWHPPESGRTSLSLADDPRIDLSSLVDLVEQSFRRTLDVDDYLSRIHGRVAGLIIAGAYEGGAILTWEMPPGASSPARLVPYLDKFAVLPSSQGSSGVADVVFQAMVRTCFPHGVCWRSRRNNPVNKWYFERSAGSWHIPGTQWTMFWTGEGVVEDKQRWEDYVAVCRQVEPSWADQTKASG